MTICIVLYIPVCLVWFTISGSQLNVILGQPAAMLTAAGLADSFARARRSSTISQGFRGVFLPREFNINYWIVALQRMQSMIERNEWCVSKKMSRCTDRQVMVQQQPVRSMRAFTPIALSYFSPQYDFYSSSCTLAVAHTLISTL